MSSTQESRAVITTFAGGPQSGPAVELAHSPDALAVHGTLVYIADQQKHFVYRVDTATGRQTVVAGMGLGGFSGDGGPASEAELNMPGGLAVDASGNLFIADTRNGRIRKVQAGDGTISTIAGIGPSGVGEVSFSGDGGKATEARLDLPTALAVEASGTVYFADSGNDRIRAVRVDGTIATVAGSGEGSTDDGGLAIDARFVLPTGDPYGIAVDAAGNLYIPEPFNRRVRKVDGQTGILTTIVGSGDVGSVLESPFAVAVGPDGNVYVVDSGNNFVLRLAGNGTISTVAGNGTTGFSGDGGPAPDAQLQHPRAVAVGADGEVLIGDRGNSRVRRVDSRTHVISTVAGNGPPLLTFIQADGLAVDQHDNVYLSDVFHRVCKIDGATGKFSVVAGSVVGFSGDGGPARDAQLQTPWRLSVDAAGNLYISDHGNRRVRKVDAQSGVISTVAGNGQLSGFFAGGLAIRTPLQFLLGTCVDGAGNLYIADAGFHCVQKVEAETGKLLTVAGVVEFGDGKSGSSGDGGPATKALLHSPAGVAVDPAGNLYIADTENHRIRRVDAGSGVITTVAGGGDDDPGVEPKPATSVKLGRPVQLAFDHGGNLLVSDTESHQVVLVDLAAGTVRRVAGNGTAGFSGDGGPGPAASLRAPVGIAVDSAGRVLIADSGNQRLRRIEQQK
jgi:trimeric autotransporter adhesin